MKKYNSTFMLESFRKINMIKIYGIKNCDTMKKAFKWLDDNDLDYQFHDYRKDGIDVVLVNDFVDELGLELVLNKRGTTWRKLPEEMKNGMDEARAVSLLVENEAMIKRPIFDLGNIRVVGFSKQEQSILADLLLK